MSVLITFCNVIQLVGLIRFRLQVGILETNNNVFVFKFSASPYIGNRCNIEKNCPIIDK